MPVSVMAGQETTAGAIHAEWPEMDFTAAYDDFTKGYRLGLRLIRNNMLSYFTGYGKLLLDLTGSIYPDYTISPLGSVFSANNKAGKELCTC